MKNRSLLGIILLVALLLRLFQLNQIRLTHDEMSIGYNAYSILKTGRDEWGKAWPLVFRAFGEGKLPGYIYASVPMIALFGLNSLGVKLVSVISGVLAIWLLYLLIEKLSKQAKIGVLAAIIMAISPWPLHLSRMALESNLALMFFLAGLVFWVKFEHEKSIQIWKSTSFWLAALFLGLTGYTYIAYRMFVPILFVTLSLINALKSKASTRIISSLPALLLAIVVIVLQLPFFVDFNQTNTSRFSTLFVQNEAGSTALSTEKNNFCFLTATKLAPVCRYLYSAKIYSVQAIASSYLHFLSPNFVFLDGDPLTYLGVPGQPEIYVFLLPFYLFGLFRWLILEKNKSYLLLVGFLIAPLPGALAGSPQIVRGSPLLPFIIFFTASGFYYAYRWLKSIRQKMVTNFLMVIFLMVAGLYICQFALEYFLIYPRQYRADFYQLGPEAVRFLLENQNSFDQIYITNDFPDAHIALAFYGQIEPNFYQMNAVRPDPDSFGFQHLTQLDKFVFGQRLEDLATNPEYRNWLYATGATQNVPVTKAFTSYSGIHTEAKMVDINQAFIETNDTQNPN